jgi:hypothetical protein
VIAFLRLQELDIDLVIKHLSYHDEKVFYPRLGRCQPLYLGKRRFLFKHKLFSQDATVIELCASLFDWAKFRQTKGAVKLHLLLDHDGYLPVFAHITDGKVHEVKVAQAMTFPSGSIVAIDKGYIDYELFWRWTQGGVFFVTRQKDNAHYRVLEERPIPKYRNILSDQIIEMEGFYSHQKYPGNLRRIEVWDEENEKVIVLLTNHMTFGSTTIAAIYKDRWQIEIFFKTISERTPPAPLSRPATAPQRQCVDEQLPAAFASIGPASSPSANAARRVVSAAAPCSSSPRRPAQASATACSTCRNDGIPWRGFGGK